MDSCCRVIVVATTLLSAALASSCSDCFDATNTEPGRELLVHLFEWKWTDIADECESFLSRYGYGAVQISPPNEHIMLDKDGDMPWWVRYQPVSYKLHSRSGTDQQFVDMVERCNKVGIRIVSDSVINHMTGAGSEGYGSAGSYFNAKSSVESFPAVPYNSTDFNDKYCNHDINDYNNPWEVRECRLVSLLDLDQRMPYVRQKIADYMNRMTEIGVAGFRVDAGKHMWPFNLKKINDLLKNIRQDIYKHGNKHPFLVYEVIDQGHEAISGSEYTGLGRITNFRYGLDLTAAVKRQKNFLYFGNFGIGWGYWPSHDVVVFVDNHDNQRGSGGGGSVLTFKDQDMYRMAVHFMLAWNYGYPRVMSSYYFNHTDQGPPSIGKFPFATTGPKFNSDGSCNAESGWVCEHRWPSIRRMSVFHQVTSGQPTLDIVTRNNRIAFRRGNKGFFALNNELNFSWHQKFQTGLPVGEYCDVVLGEVKSGVCTGRTIAVGADGMADVYVMSGSTLAIHELSKVTKPKTPNFQHTAILIHKKTFWGQNLFIRGGIDHNRIPGCLDHVTGDPCSIPIRLVTNVRPEFESYTAWSKGNIHLNWYGAEEGQGSYKGQKAQGTPLVWSTNDKNNAGYQPLNKYGPDYWLVEMEMDCSKTLDGWFELKAVFGSDGFFTWESDIHETNCLGDAGGKPPYTSSNHLARCGYINVFSDGSSNCIVN